MTNGPSRSQSGHRADPGAAALLLSIRNFPDVANCYGEGFANTVLDGLCERAAGFLDRDKISVLARGERRFLVVGDALSQVPSGKEDGVEALLVALGGAPFVMDGVSVLVALSVVAGGDDAFLAIEQLADGGVAGSLYAQLMTQAVAAYEAVAAGRLALVFQAIRAVDDADLLYHECLARLVSPSHGQGLILPAAFVPAIERLGLCRLFDRFVVLETIATLRAAPVVRLGCNISAQSAVEDAYWSSIFSILAAEPQLAMRLVIEITETSTLPGLEAARDFVARLRGFGCQVAVDDFGVGFISIRQVVALRPDIIKVDGTFLRDAVEKVCAAEFLSNLVALSSCLAAHVVVEGVEDERGIQVAHAAGAQWVQGYYIARPSEFHDRLSRAVSAVEVADRVRMQAVEHSAGGVAAP